MPPQKLLSEDAWLSDKLGKPAFRVDATSVSKTSEADFASELASVATGDYFAFAKFSCSEPSLPRAFAEQNFVLTDTNLTFETHNLSGSEVSSKAEFLVASEKHAEGIGRIAEEEFVYSRFHLDPLVPNHIASLIKKEWVLNYFEGQRGDLMITALVNGEPAGFLQILISGRTFTIDLIAVSSRFRNMGIAKGMIAFAWNQPGCESLRVGTQAANIPSVRLYEALGFRLVSSSYIFHYHHLGNDL